MSKHFNEDRLPIPNQLQRSPTGISKGIKILVQFLITKSFLKNETQALLAIIVICLVVTYAIFAMFISEGPVDEKYIYDPAIHNQ